MNEYLFKELFLNQAAVNAKLDMILKELYGDRYKNPDYESDISKRRSNYEIYFLREVFSKYKSENASPDSEKNE